MACAPRHRRHFDVTLVTYDFSKDIKSPKYNIEIDLGRI